MSEHAKSRKYGTRPSVAIGIVTSLLLANTLTAAESYVRPRFSHCHTDPKPNLPRKNFAVKGKPLTTAKPISIHQNTGRSADGYRGPLQKNIVDTVDGAVVKVGDIGSGFLVSGKNNEPLVITAAHVANAARLSDVIIADTSGNTSKLAEGCWLYGSNGDVTPDNIDKPRQVDIAIFRLQQRLGSTTLAFANAPPDRGSCIGFYNFQQKRPVDNPANFTGIALDVRGTHLDNSALVGLGKEHNPPLYEHIAVGGASGGPIVDCDSGDLVGMSVSVHYDSQEKLNEYGVKILQSVSSTSDKGYVVGFVDSATIQDTLDKSPYQPTTR